MKAEYKGGEFYIATINFKNKYMIIGEKDFSGLFKVSLDEAVMLVSKKGGLKMKII